MAKNLAEFLQETPAGSFKPVPHYFSSGDFVTYYFKEDRCYAQRVDDVLTIYLACDTNEIVGCKVKGVKHILETAGAFGVTLDGGDVELGLFFFVGAVSARDEVQKKRYAELGNIAKNVRLPREQLLPAIC